MLLRHPGVGFDISVNYKCTDGTALHGQDFLRRTGIATIKAGNGDVMIRIKVKGDALVEPDETFSVIISNPVNATIHTDTATGVILNDD